MLLISRCVRTAARAQPRLHAGHGRARSAQILTLEDWEIFTYKVAKYTNWGSAAFVLAWIIVGHYIFLTLFLAVILESFESKYDEEAGAEAYLAHVTKDAQAAGSINAVEGGRNSSSLHISSAGPSDRKQLTAECEIRPEVCRAVTSSPRRSHALPPLVRRCLAGMLIAPPPTASGRLPGHAPRPSRVDGRRSCRRLADPHAPGRRRTRVCWRYGTVIMPGSGGRARCGARASFSCVAWSTVKLPASATTTCLSTTSGA